MFNIILMKVNNDIVLRINAGGLAAKTGEGIMTDAATTRLSPIGKNIGGNRERKFLNMMGRALIAMRKNQDWA
jgi:hypothetical protein